MSTATAPSPRERARTPLTAAEKARAEELLADPALRRGIRWAANRMRRFDRGNFSAEDLEQVGLHGAAQSVRTFDASRGASRRSWALTQAKASMMSARYTYGWLPTYLQKILRKERAEWPVRIQALGDDTQVAEAREAVPEAIGEAELGAIAQGRMEVLLSDRQEAIVRARVLDERTLASIAEEHGVTTQRIQQIVARGLEKLRQSMARMVR